MNRTKKITLGLLLSLGLPLEAGANTSLRDRLEDWKSSVVLTLAVEDKLGGAELERDSHVFNPRVLTLDEAVEIALENNLGFQNSFAGIETSVRRLNATRASIFEPSLQFSWGRRANNSPAQGFIPQFTSTSESGGVEYSKTWGDGTGMNLAFNTRNSASSLRSPQNNSGLTLNFSRALVGKDNQFFAQRIQLRTAEREREISHLAFLDAFQSLALQVVESFLNTVKAFQQIDVSKSVLSYRRELLGLTQIKFKLGVVTRLDVLRVEVQVAREEESLIQAQNRYENQLDSLLNLLNYERHQGKIKLEYKPDVREISYDPVALEGLALAQRLDLKIQELRLEKERLNLLNKQEQVKNKIQLTASMRKHATDDTFKEAQDYSDRDWSLGLNYSVPLGNRKDREDLLAQRLALENLKRNTEELENRVGLEVRSNIRTLQATRKRLDVMQKNLERARENLKLARLSYEKGIKSSIDVLDAQDDLQSVNKDYIDTQLDLKIAEFRLDRSTGSIELPLSVRSMAGEWGGF
jgi:outer membrane protein TolC